MHKKQIILILKIVVAAGILAFIFTKIPFADVWQSLRQADKLYVGVSFAILIAMRYVMAYRIRIFTSIHDMKISLQQFFEISLVTNFYGLFLPGTLGGGVVRWYKISQAGKKPAQSFTAIVYDRLISTLGIIMVGTVFWLFERQAQTSQGMGVVLLAALAVLVVSYVVAFNGKVAALLLRLNRSLTMIPEFIREKVRKILESSMDYRNISERKHLEIFAVSIAYDFCGILSMYLFSRALGLPLTFVHLGWIRSVVLILAMLPISFSGIGVREGGMIFLLQAYGIEPSRAIALSFLVLSGNIVLALCGGMIELKNTFVKGQRPVMKMPREVQSYE